MTELERFAAALVAQWRGEGGGDREPIAVSALLDRVLPYRVARRLLGIDSSEDYEALMLRLLAEEEGLVAVSPADAADLAKATSSARLPDLGVLQLLRSASATLTERTVTQLADAAPAPGPTPAPGPELKWAPDPDPKPRAAPVVKPKPAKGPAAPAPAVAACWSCSEALPADRMVKFCPFCGADQRQPACAACGATAERAWKHCVECGAKL